MNEIRATSVATGRESQAAEHGQLDNLLNLAEGCRSCEVITCWQKYASPYNSKVQECFPPS